MNRTEWESCNDPRLMLHWLRERGSERKFRLFACACLRRIESVFVELGLELLPALEAEERLADGRPSLYTPPRRGMWASGYGEERAAARRVLETLGHGPAWNVAGFVADSVLHLLMVKPIPARPFHPQDRPESAIQKESQAQAALVRDLFGHLFHPDPPWMGCLDRTGEVEHLARTIYDDRSFREMPVLADALEDAGCTDESILDHCRDGGEHARGCWVLDSILGRG